MNPKLLEIASRNLKKDLPEIKVGDTVKVTVRITEGNKERNQNYEGVVIKIKGGGINKTFTVRRIFQNIGVERVFLMNSKKIEKIKIVRSGKSRRAKLYFLRSRTGKATKLKEIIGGVNRNVQETAKEEVPSEATLVEATT